jgi:hypothetical protein
LCAYVLCIRINIRTNGKKEKINTCSKCCGTVTAIFNSNRTSSGTGSASGSNIKWNTKVKNQK